MRNVMKEATSLIDKQLDGREWVRVRLIADLVWLLKLARKKRKHSEQYVSILHQQLRAAGMTPKGRP